MSEQSILKRNFLRKNYRVVAEIKNNGDTTFLVEFKIPLITFDTFTLPQFNLFNRWKICHEWISSHRKEMEGLKEAGWVETRYNLKLQGYHFIEQELERCNIKYGDKIKKRLII